MSETPLPADLVAEEAVIGSCLVDKTLFTRTRPELKGEHFVTALNRAVWEAMCSLDDDGQEISYVSVSGKSPSGSAWNWPSELVRLMSAEGVYAQDVNGAVRRLRFVCTSRRIIAASSEAARIAFMDSSGDEDALLARAVSAFENEAGMGDARTHITAPKDLATEHYELLERRKAKDPAYIGWPTGIGDLDRITALRPGEFWIIAATPASGKTALMTNICDNLARKGIPALFASAEQPQMQLMDRLVAADTGIDSWKIAHGDLDEFDFDSVSGALARRRELPFYIYDDGGMTTASLAATVQLAVTKYHIRVVAVDYVQLLTDQVGDRESERVGYISRRLREIARRYGVCIVAASQLRKRPTGHQDSHATLDDLYESGRLAQDPFVVLSLKRNTNDPMKASEAEVLVIKNRNGQSGVTIPLYFDAKRTRFTSVARVA